MALHKILIPALLDKTCLFGCIIFHKIEIILLLICMIKIIVYAQIWCWDIYTYIYIYCI